MSKYTTGELARLCGVSVRTVQYYDTRGILTPSELSEGGRRLYTDADKKRLDVICVLRDVGMPISSIGELLSEKDPGSVISILMDRQEKELREELRNQQDKLDKLVQIRRGLKDVSSFSVESIGDIANVMANRKMLFRMRGIMICAGFVMEAIEIVTLVIWIKTGVWLPFAIGMCVIAAMAAWASVYYFRRVAYICPQCHKVFKPRFREAFFAYHTPTTRKLKCPKCGHKGHCVETYGE